MTDTATAVRERPILFSDEMVRAILEGRKTQTRRVMKSSPSNFAGGVHPNNAPRHPSPYFDAYCGERKTVSNPRGMGNFWCWWTEDDRQGPDWILCPYGAPGDRLWVREAWTYEPPSGGWDEDGPPLVYHRATDPSPHLFRWRPSIHMPRHACRLILEVTDLRVERVQDISEGEAPAEGLTLTADGWRVGPHLHGSASGCFHKLWDSINGPRGYGWDANPWVWVIAFRVVPPDA